MNKIIIIVSFAALASLGIIYSGGAAAVGDFKPVARMATVALPPQQDTGNCVEQTRWISNDGRMMQVARSVCY